MSNNKYQFKGTPGPWLFVKTQMIGRSMGEADFNISSWDKQDGRFIKIANCWEHNDTINHVDKSQSEANADLIAAAPDLLEALQDLVYTAGKLWNDANPIKDTEAFTTTHPIIENAKSAIHKALNIEAEEA